jgi:hypothetical protein
MKLPIVSVWVPCYEIIGDRYIGRQCDAEVLTLHLATNTMRVRCDGVTSVEVLNVPIGPFFEKYTIGETT